MAIVSLGSVLSQVHCRWVHYYIWASLSCHHYWTFFLYLLSQPNLMSDLSSWVKTAKTMDLSYFEEVMKTLTACNLIFWSSLILAIKTWILLLTPSNCILSYFGFVTAASLFIPFSPNPLVHYTEACLPFLFLFHFYILLKINNDFLHYGENSHPTFNFFLSSLHLYILLLGNMVK